MEPFLYHDTCEKTKKIQAFSQNDDFHSGISNFDPSSCFLVVSSHNSQDKTKKRKKEANMDITNFKKNGIQKKLFEFNCLFQNRISDQFMLHVFVS